MTVSKNEKEVHTRSTTDGFLVEFSTNPFDVLLLREGRLVARAFAVAPLQRDGGSQNSEEQRRATELEGKWRGGVRAVQLGQGRIIRR